MVWAAIVAAVCVFATLLVARRLFFAGSARSDAPRRGSCRTSCRRSSSASERSTGRSGAAWRSRCFSRCGRSRSRRTSSRSMRPRRGPASAAGGMAPRRLRRAHGAHATRGGDDDRRLRLACARDRAGDGAVMRPVVAELARIALSQRPRGRARSRSPIARFTGEWSANGALVKLAINNPYFGRAEKIDDYNFNLHYASFATSSTTSPTSRLRRHPPRARRGRHRRRPRTRRMALAPWTQAAPGWRSSSLNGQVRWQNERYTMPAVAWLIMVAALGVWRSCAADPRATDVLRGGDPGRAARPALRRRRPPPEHRPRASLHVALRPRVAAAVSPPAPPQARARPRRRGGARPRARSSGVEDARPAVVLRARVAQHPRPARHRPGAGSRRASTRSSLSATGATGGARWRSGCSSATPARSPTRRTSRRSTSSASGASTVPVRARGGERARLDDRADGVHAPARAPRRARPCIRAGGDLSRPLLRAPCSRASRSRGTSSAAGYEDVVYRADWHLLNTGNDPREAPQGEAVKDEVDRRTSSAKGATSTRSSTETTGGPR